MMMQSYSHMGHERIIIVYVSCVIHVFNCIPIYVSLCNMLLMRTASLGRTVQLEYKMTSVDKLVRDNNSNR